MKICFLNDIDFIGGGETWVLRACRYLASIGHEVSVICPHRSELQVACQTSGIRVFVLPQPWLSGQPFYAGLCQFLQDFGADVLYCTVMGRFCEARVLEEVAARVNAERGEAKMAVFLKAGLPPLGDLASEYFGAGSGPAVRRLHVVAKNVKVAFHTFEPAMTDGFVEVHYEGVDLEQFDGKRADRARAKASLGIPADHLVITCLARLVDGMKGQSVLLRTVPDLVKTYPKTTLLIAGDGADRELLEELRDDLEIREWVRFTGVVDDVPTLLAATDILCHPSLNDGLPNAIVEAMAMGVPVVASRIGGTPELIEEGVSGMLTLPNDVSGVRSALAELLSNAEKRAVLGREGRARVAGRLDLRANLDALVRRLEEELASFRALPNEKTAPPQPARVPPVRVMFLMNVIRLGGEETELGILARYLDKQRFPMSVLCLESSDEVAPAFDKLRDWNIPIDMKCVQLAGPERKARYIVEKIRRDKIGLVVACQDPSVAYRVFDELTPDECRLIEHGGVIQDAAFIPKDRTTRYIGVSRPITSAAAARMEAPEHAVFIPSMVDLDLYEGAPWAGARAATADWMREVLLTPGGYGDDACVVVFVGRLDPKKRVEDFIEAARELRTECPQAFFLVVGGHDSFEPSYAPRILEEASDLSAEKRLAFTGARGDVPGILAASHILVLPSTGEGMAHVINEAGAAGLAVVATDDGAAREQLDEGASGVLVAPRNVRQLTEALRGLIRDPERRRALGERLRSKVRAEYAAERVIEEWHRVLTDAGRGLQQRPRSRLTVPGLRVIEPDEPLSFPAEIQIQTNTFCNATCIMCPHPEVKKEVSMGHMEEALYRKILEECGRERGITRIEPFLMNEPFTDKRLLDWIHLAKSMVPQAQVTVTTNGSLVTPPISDRLGASGLDGIWFSYNGATDETYLKIMGIPRGEVKANIDYLLSVKPESLKVYVNMIETTPMRDEISSNIAEWTTRGVEAGASPLVNRAGNVRNFDDLNYKPVSAGPIRVCELAFHKMYVLYTGDVILCCMDWRREVVLGNLYTQTIREVWNGEQYRNIRDKLIARRSPELPLCSSCSYTHK